MKPGLVWAGGFALLVIIYLPMCTSHHRPVQVKNDTSGAVKIYLSPYKILPEYVERLPAVSPIEPGDGFGVYSCSKEREFAYLATATHPQVVAYRIRDFCDPDECSCDIKIGELERQRARLAVPWQKAGTSWSLSRNIP